MIGAASTEGDGYSRVRSILEVRSTLSKTSTRLNVDGVILDDTAYSSILS